MQNPISNFYPVGKRGIISDDYWEDASKEAFGKHPLTRKLNCKRLFQVYKQKDALFDQQYIRHEISIWQYRTMRFIETLAELDCFADQKDADEFQLIYLSVSRKHMRIRSEIISLLGRLQKCFKLGIVTNGTCDMQSAKIEGSGVKPFFTDETIFISEQVGFEKPDPNIYKAALDYFGVQPYETVFIGDSWQNDVRGPYTIGIKPIWLNRKQNSIPEEGNTSFFQFVHCVFHFVRH